MKKRFNLLNKNILVHKKVLWIFLSIFVALTISITGCVESPVEYKYTIPDDLSTPPPTPRDLLSAMDDYKWKLDLVKKQKTRLEMYYVSKSGVSMTQEEYRGWLDDLSEQTTEFIKRCLDAIRSGKEYTTLLNAEVQAQNIDYSVYSKEFDRVIKNNELLRSVIKDAYDDLISAIDQYNSTFVR